LLSLSYSTKNSNHMSVLQFSLIISLKFPAPITQTSTHLLSQLARVTQVAANSELTTAAIT